MATQAPTQKGAGDSPRDLARELRRSCERLQNAAKALEEEDIGLLDEQTCTERLENARALRDEVSARFALLEGYRRETRFGRRRKDPTVDAALAESSRALASASRAYCAVVKKIAEALSDIRSKLMLIRQGRTMLSGYKSATSRTSSLNAGLCSPPLAGSGADRCGGDHLFVG